jgi:hypothetical protein
MRISRRLSVVRSTFQAWKPFVICVSKRYVAECLLSAHPSIHILPFSQTFGIRGERKQPSGSNKDKQYLFSGLSMSQEVARLKKTIQNMKPGMLPHSPTLSLIRRPSSLSKKNCALGAEREERERERELVNFCERKCPRLCVCVLSLLCALSISPSPSCICLSSLSSLALVRARALALSVSLSASLTPSLSLLLSANKFMISGLSFFFTDVVIISN